MISKLVEALGKLSTKPPVQVPPPPVFSRGNATAFFDQFEKYAKSVYGDDSTSWTQVLPQFLGGEPRDLAMAFGPQGCYEDIRRRICTECIRGQSVLGRSVSGFYRATRRLDESVKSWGVRLETLAHEEVGDKPSQKEAVVMERFLSGLSPALVEELRTQLAPWDTPSFDQVVRMAVTLEPRYGTPLTQKGLVGAASGGTGTAGNTAGGPERAVVVCRHCGDARHEETDCWRRTATCYTCGEIGHFSRDCGARRPASGDARGPGRGGRLAIAATPVCVYCGEEGHLMSRCKEFKKQFACVWCGDVNHQSYKCENRDRQPLN
jgi:hypothetical protein